jgi:methyl-accepting chemotaxis protein
MSDKKKIDEKLAELCASIKEFSSLTDRTKAIETLAKKMASIGEEHLSEAERRVKAMCDGLLESLKSAKTAPEKLEAASKKLNGKADECVGEIDEKLADMEGRVSTCVLKLGQAVKAIDKSTAAADQAIESKIAEIESSSPIDGFEEFKKSVGTRLSALEKKNTALGEKLSEMDGALKEIKEMIAKIPTKRGIFG